MKTAVEMVDRMEALVRELAAWRAERWNTTVAPPLERMGNEARAIVAELPEIDPYILKARQIIADIYGNRSGNGEGPARVPAIVDGQGDDYYEMRAVLAALKQGHELASQG